MCTQHLYFQFGFGRQRTRREEVVEGRTLQKKAPVHSCKAMTQGFSSLPRVLLRTWIFSTMEGERQAVGIGRCISANRPIRSSAGHAHEYPSTVRSIQFCRSAPTHVCQPPLTYCQYVHHLKLVDTQRGKGSHAVLRAAALCRRDFDGRRSFASCVQWEKAP